MTFKYLEKIAIADIAFEVKSKTLNGLFKDAGMAANDISVAAKSVKPKEKRTITMVAEDLEHLLYDFLSEIIFIKDTDGFLINKMTVKVNAKNKSLNAALHGEKINRKRHDLRNDLKAITMHMFLLRKKKPGWYARVVVDI